jgi:hypothetical protein
MVLLAGLVACRGDWQKAIWKDETAWLSDSGEWRAVVSENRARLIYLGPRDVPANLLYVPESAEENRPRGGHIFWLGPQSEWKGKWGAWPPPEEWEQQAAHSAKVEGNWLRLTMPRPDEKLPQLERAYGWKDGRLLCRVSWAEGTGYFQGIQIIQLPPEAKVRAERLAQTPPGFVRFDTKGKQSFQPETLGPDTRLLSDEFVELATGAEPTKFGFLPQTLRAQVGDLTLEMGRGPMEGSEVNSPDRGFESQVYFGGTKYPFVEIEQLTPRLLTTTDRENSFTIWLKPGFDKPEPASP